MFCVCAADRIMEERRDEEVKRIERNASVWKNGKEVWKGV
jgi:hypothetical protein